MSQEFDTDCTDEVICPYCGHNNGGDDGDGPPSGEVQCYNEECEKKFHCEPSYSVYYYTKKVPCWNGDPHDWNVDRSFSFDHGDKKFNPKYCRECGQRGRDEVSNADANDKASKV